VVGIAIIAFVLAAGFSHFGSAGAFCAAAIVY
jgi:hypothetical protein